MFEGRGGAERFSREVVPIVATLLVLVPHCAATEDELSESSRLRNMDLICFKLG